jgi:hypothetical protein
MQHDDARRGHPVVTAPGAIPVFGGQVPGARIDLAGDTGVRPPSVGLAQEEVPVVQGRVEQGHRQPRCLDKVAQVAFGRRPDAVGYLGEDRAEHRRALDGPDPELLGELADGTPT